MSFIQLCSASMQPRHRPFIIIGPNVLIIAIFSIATLFALYYFNSVIQQPPTQNKGSGFVIQQPPTQNRGTGSSYTRLALKNMTSADNQFLYGNIMLLQFSEMRNRSGTDHTAHYVSPLFYKMFSQLKNKNKRKNESRDMQSQTFQHSKIAYSSNWTDCRARCLLI